MYPMMFIDPEQPNNWPAPQSAYDAETLAFCRAWLAGQERFTLFTSGSTGAPRPIELSRAQMQASARLTGQTLGLQPGDAALVCLNIHYVAGIMMLIRGLELGLPMTVVAPTGNPLLHFTPDKDAFAFTALVPLQLQTILETSPEKIPLLNGMKAILVGGAATSPALETKLNILRAPVYATYGMTETVSHIALRRLNGPDASDLFTALDGVCLGIDTRNCLHITAAATNHECVQTNDVVALIPPSGGLHTQFRLLGRADRVINSGGVKVQPEPVEQLIINTLLGLSEHNTPAIPRLFVTGLPDERLGQRVVLITEKVPIQEKPWEQIQQRIRREIGPYAVPKECITIQQFQETPTGKVDQKATIAQIP